MLWPKMYLQVRCAASAGALILPRGLLAARPAASVPPCRVCPFPIPPSVLLCRGIGPHRQEDRLRARQRKGQARCSWAQCGARSGRCLGPRARCLAASSAPRRLLPSPGVCVCGATSGSGSSYTPGRQIEWNNSPDGGWTVGVKGLQVRRSCRPADANTFDIPQACTGIQRTRCGTSVSAGRLGVGGRGIGGGGAGPHWWRRCWGSAERTCRRHSFRIRSAAPQTIGYSYQVPWRFDVMCDRECQDRVAPACTQTLANEARAGWCCGAGAAGCCCGLLPPGCGQTRYRVRCPVPRSPLPPPVNRTSGHGAPCSRTRVPPFQVPARPVLISSRWEAAVPSTA